MLYFVISFDIENSHDGLRYPLPGFLDLAVLDGSFSLKEQRRIPFSDNTNLVNLPSFRDGIQAGFNFSTG